MRFRRRVRICKGLSLNFSGSGISMSMGVRGASVTVGKQGIYANYGIPGTGLYNRQKIASGSSLSTRTYSSSRSTANSYQHQKVTVNLKMSLDENNNPIVADANGNVITDENLLRAIRRSQGYKETFQRLSQDVYNEIADKNASFIEIYKHTERPVTEFSVTKALENIQPEEYEKNTFASIEPTVESVRSQLENEAKEKVTSLLFWTLKRKREQYVCTNLQERYNETHDSWSKEKKKANPQTQVE